MCDQPTELWIRLSCNSTWIYNKVTRIDLVKFICKHKGLPGSHYVLPGYLQENRYDFFALHLALKGDDMHGFRNRQCFSHLTWIYYPEKPQRPWLTYSMVNYVLNIYRSFSPHLNYNFAMYHKCKMDFSAL